MPVDNNPNLAISFGSCYGIWSLESSIFETIEATTNLFIWLGDVAYLDEMTSLFAIPFTFKTMPLETVLHRLQRTKDAPGYKELEASGRIVGVWDDHDYGQNDAGKEMPLRKQNR